MRRIFCASALVLAVVALGCQSDGGGGSRVLGGGRLPERGTLFVKVFNEDAVKTGPAEIELKLDGEKILDRNFTMGENSYDGQYQIQLPQGRHLLEAKTPQGGTFTSRAFNLKDKAFIQVYVTEDSKWRLTSGSRRSLVRLVIKRTREARGVNSDPALWMIIPAPTPSAPTREKRNFGIKPAGSTGKPFANATREGKQ